MITLALAATVALAQDTMQYQGRLVDATGAPVHGTHQLDFGAYLAAEDGEAVWSETHPEVVLDSGYFTVELGSTVPLDGLFDSASYLQIDIDETPLLPRQRMSAVPHSRSASEAVTLTGGSVAFVREHSLDHTAAMGMCAGMLPSYGSMLVVRSNGVSCNSACDAQDNPSGGPYSNYYCYGSVGADTIASTPQAASAVVGGGWFGVGYCGGINGMNTYCCCKSNYPNNGG